VIELGHQPGFAKLVDVSGRYLVESLLIDAFKDAVPLGQLFPYVIIL
jgi:hypothetical protein